MIYLDNASTTKIDPEVLEAMMPYLTDEFGNAGTLYSLGFSARKAIDAAREQVAGFVGAESPEQIIFTSGGTESNNMVFHGYGFKELENERKRGVIVSSIEHDSVLRSAQFLNTKLGFDLSYVRPDHLGVVLQDVLGRVILGKEIGLVSVMYMNNEIGSINDIRKLSDECHKVGAVFHSDCVQAAGCLELDADKLGCDFISLSSHKIHGPKGVGALYIRNKSKLTPMIFGGAVQEFGYRGGTENVAGIIGFGKACELARLSNNRPTLLKRIFWNALCQELRGSGLINIVRDNALSSVKHGKTLSVTLEGVDAEALVLLLGTRGVCVSAGSACTSHEQNPSHVLVGIGMPADEARNTVTLSFSRMNTENEVKKAANIVATAAKELYERKVM